MNLILLGPPGCGKGTQGAILAKRTGIRRVSTGDLLRAAVEQGTALGREAKTYMDKGLLVPDEIIVGLLREVLADPSTERGILMDGFPRTIPQAEAVDRLLTERGRSVDRVILLDVPDEELLRRIMSRAKLEGRADDTPEAFRQRIAVYREQTGPLVEFYGQRDLVAPVQAVGSIEEIAEDVRVKLGA